MKNEWNVFYEDETGAQNNTLLRYNAEMKIVTAIIEDFVKNVKPDSVKFNTNKNTEGDKYFKLDRILSQAITVLQKLGYVYGIYHMVMTIMRINKIGKESKTDKDSVTY
jgi:hypothetical protein